MLNKTDLSRIDLNLLVLFEVVYEQRHVARAAARLNVSASAVSHGLGRLRTLLNDPLFLRNPKGVVPTARALALAEPVAEILARARSVFASADAFDARRSQRRFMLGAPDGVTAVLLPPLLARIRRTAPGIDLGIRNLVGRFDVALEELDRRELDLALIPHDEAPARFSANELYHEDFVIVMRRGHPLGRKPTARQYCDAQHLVVSVSGDPHGNVDTALARLKLARRVALTVPNFMLGLAVVAGSDLVGAMPRKFVAMHGSRFGITQAELPLKMLNLPIRAIAPKVALLDAGIAWLIRELELTVGELPRPRR